MSGEEGSERVEGQAGGKWKDKAVGKEGVKVNLRREQRNGAPGGEGQSMVDDGELNGGAGGEKSCLKPRPDRSRVPGAEQEERKKKAADGSGETCDHEDQTAEEAMTERRGEEEEGRGDAEKELTIDSAVEGIGRSSGEGGDGHGAGSLTKAGEELAGDGKRGDEEMDRKGAPGGEEGDVEKGDGVGGEVGGEVWDKREVALMGGEEGAKGSGLASVAKVGGPFFGIKDAAEEVAGSGCHQEQERGKEEEAALLSDGQKVQAVEQGRSHRMVFKRDGSSGEQDQQSLCGMRAATPSRYRLGC